MKRMFLYTDLLWPRLRVKGSLRSLNNNNTNNKKSTCPLSVYVHLVPLQIKFKQQPCEVATLGPLTFSSTTLGQKCSNYKTIRVSKSCEACWQNCWLLIGAMWCVCGCFFKSELSVAVIMLHFTHQLIFNDGSLFMLTLADKNRQRWREREKRSESGCCDALSLEVFSCIVTSYCPFRSKWRWLNHDSPESF